VVFVNGTLDMVGARDKPLNPLLDELKKFGVKLVPVGVGEHAKLSELNKIASDDVTALHYGEYESPRTLGTAVIQGKLCSVAKMIVFRDCQVMKTKDPMQCQYGRLLQFAFPEASILLLSTIVNLMRALGMRLTIRCPKENKRKSTAALISFPESSFPLTSGRKTRESGATILK